MNISYPHYLKLETTTYFYFLVVNNNKYSSHVADAGVIRYADSAYNMSTIRVNYIIV